MNLSAILDSALQAVAAAADVNALEDVRVEYFGKKGSITELLKSLGAMDAE
ncbi:MAG: phenylalanine--tRNA ligase subunit alpha, partial [Chromatiaceae bacterium]